MDTRESHRSCVIGLIVLLGYMMAPGPLFAQAPPATQPRGVEIDPIRCWWKTDRNAVRVGEPFVLVLTCSVIETGSITVVPALNQLEPGALSVTPFEVVGGSRREDVLSPPWRYIQFE